MIACVGWGSLLWDPRELPLAGAWRPDGPELPVEFARQAANDRITLVIVEGWRPCRTQWAPLAAGSPAEAVAALAAREGCEERWIGAWPGEDRQRSADHWTPGPAAPGYAAVAEWAGARGLAGAVWTGLPIGLEGGRGRMPSLDKVIGHLQGLAGEARERAAEYVRRAPAQTRTRWRPRLEEALGPP